MAVLVVGGEVFDEDVKEEDGERQDEAEDEPNINELDVGRRGEFIGDRHVQGVHDQHGGDGHRDVGFEVLLVEVECGLADDHQAECGDVGVVQVVVENPLESYLNLNRHQASS